MKGSGGREEPRGLRERAREETPPSEPVVETRDLSKLYGGVAAVKGVDLRVERGRVYGLLGPNGAGKTTMMRLLLGLARPSAGEVRLFGRPLSGGRAGALSRVGALVETPAAFGHLSGRENLELLRRLRGCARGEADRVLRAVGLAGAGDRRVRAYSLGMKQRLGLAAAMLGGPELLILDEPTNGLDPAGIRQVRDLIRRLPTEHGATVLLSSHLLPEVEQVATHVGIVHEGVLRFQGAMEELRARAAGSSVEAEVDDPALALRLLRARYAGGVEVRGGRIRVRAPAGDAGEINRTLVLGGVTVGELSPRRQTLEDLFLSLAGGPTGLPGEEA
jgi:ABC-2 type transport system ATP-binding protein